MCSLGNRIFLVGARACGKTTVGRHLAALLQWAFIDTDQMLMDIVGMTVAEMVRMHGWDAFRAQESAVLRQLCAAVADEGERAPRGLVIATGGGMILAEENRRMLRACGRVFYIQASVETLVSRLAAVPEAGQRPALTDLGLKDEVTQVLAIREPLYRATAHHVLDGSRPPESVARAAWDQYTGGEA